MQDSRIFKHIQGFHDELTRIRQDIHAHPELGFEELRTSSLVAAELQAMGYEVTRDLGKTGVVGVLQGQKHDSGKSIGLRADMDALPILEKNNLPYASKNSGVMHACGHDGHTTMLLGAARYLAETRNFNGTLNLIFQPAEEGQGGAQAMLDDGLFERFPCDAIFGLHNSPDQPAGKIGVISGPAMAAADLFTVHIEGQGGHGAHPYLTRDPVVIAAQLITALQTIVSRNVPALDSAVLSVAAIEAGTLNARNVVPQAVRLGGTVRSFSTVVQEQIIERMRKIMDGLAQGYDVEIQLDYQKGFPATVNTPAYARLVKEVAHELFGPQQWLADLKPSMGSEDFACMLEQRPGAYFRLGGGAEKGRGLHTDRFNFNDAVIPYGSTMFCGIVEHLMPLSTD